VSDLGDDQNGNDCLVQLQKEKVITSYIKVHKNKPTNYHFVLWYDTDRTILVNHIEYDYRLPKFTEPKWIYLTSLATNTQIYHATIVDYLKIHPKVKLAFQPGTFQIALGISELKNIYAHTDVLIMNMSEAQKILQTENRDAKAIMKKLASYGPKLVAITDGKDGAYIYDGERYYQMPIYPDPRPAVERTGCGDAWSATFISALVMGRSPLEALAWAPVNPMSVAQFVGSQEGLLDRKQLEWWLEKAPADYKPKEI
jgi:sugar/nucleoside kinase (ribokinase family)